MTTLPRKPKAERRQPAAPDQFRRVLVGSSNQRAVELVRSAAEGQLPGAGVFVSGGCGVGKTELLRAAVAHAVGLGRAAMLCDGARLAGLLAAEPDDAAARRVIDQVRALDLLAIDDARGLECSFRAQLRLCRLLDEVGLLVSNEARLTFHRVPVRTALAGRMRLLAQATIEPPDRGLRAALLERFAGELDLELSAAASDRLADRLVMATARRLRSVLQRLQAEHGGRVIELADVDELLRPQRRPTERPCGLDAVARSVHDVCGVGLDELRGRGRMRAVVDARAIFSAVAQQASRRSLPEIARFLGRNTHSMVHTAAVRAREKALDDPGFAARLDEVRARAQQAAGRGGD